VKPASILALNTSQQIGGTLGLADLVAVALADSRSNDRDTHY